MITIALCTRDGAAHLPAQLASLQAQASVRWQLWASDDHSTDTTPHILAEFARKAPPGRVRLLQGPGQGFAANFLSVLLHPDLPDGPVALCDQDDVWLPEKLARACDHLQRADPEGTQALLYSCRSRIVDETLHPTGLSALPHRAPSFGNALVENILPGNTMALSAAALALLRRAGQPAGIAYHDWWIYLLITGAGGRVLYDDSPQILYRQHRGNQIGTKRPLARLQARLRRLRKGIYSQALRNNRAALAAQPDLLCAKAKSALSAYETARQQKGRSATALLRDAGIERQSPRDTALLYAAAAAGWLP